MHDEQIAGEGGPVAAGLPAVRHDLTAIQDLEQEIRIVTKREAELRSNVGRSR